MNAQIQYGSTSQLTLGPSQTDREIAYFSAPARSGRRRHDEVGHLEMTNVRLRFHGAIDINIAWDAVAGIECVDRNLVISAGNRRRPLRFCFYTTEEADQGVLVARSMWSVPVPAA